MKTLPTTMTVLGQEVKIQISNLPEGQYGECCGQTRIIRIDPVQIKKDGLNLKGTLFHELIHMAFAISGLAHTLDKENEEAVVCCLESALTSLIKF